MTKKYLAEEISKYVDDDDDVQHGDDVVGLGLILNIVTCFKRNNAFYYLEKRILKIKY